jgi:hypothetical protein
MAIMQLFEIVGLTQDFLLKSKTEYPTRFPNMVGLSALLLYTYMMNGRCQCHRRNGIHSNVACDLQDIVVGGGQWPGKPTARMA